MKLTSLVALVFLLGSHAPVLQPSLNANSFYLYGAPLNDTMKAKILPHLLPMDHPAKPILDEIFSASRAIENEGALIQAGFEIIKPHSSSSFVVLARHSAIPGYIFKIYLDSENRNKVEIPHWKSLCNRCHGAAKIRKVIKEKKIRHFTVPDKWLYILPEYPLSREANPEPCILIETDMELTSLQVSQLAWKSLITKKHLDELYMILKHGYGSTFLVENIPYTRNKTFAFVDTEYPKRKLSLKQVKKFLSPKMQHYWENLID